MSKPVIEGGRLVSRATGGDPLIIQKETLNVAAPAGGSTHLVVKLSSDRAGTVQVFWVAGKNKDFTEEHSAPGVAVNWGPQPAT